MSIALQAALLSMAGLTVVIFAIGCVYSLCGRWMSKHRHLHPASASHADESLASGVRSAGDFTKAPDERHRGAA